MLLFLGASWTAGAADSPPPGSATSSTTAPRIAAPELDRAIEEVINRREYSWRLPRQRVAPDETKKGFFAAFMDGVIETIRKGIKIVFRWLRKVWEGVAEFIDWLWEKLGRGKTVERAERGVNWMVSLQVLVFVLLALVACTVGILFWRMWRRRRHRREEVIAEPIAAAPDLNDENTIANQLPEEGWLKLAAELMEQGDLRLALRALYLASLAHLAQREFISIAKFKSNRDYEIELRRRTRALPELQGAFAENVGAFDRVWYGMHEVSRDVLQHFQANLERIKAC